MYKVGNIYAITAVAVIGGGLFGELDSQCGSSRAGFSLLGRLRHQLYVRHHFDAIVRQFQV